MSVVLNHVAKKEKFHLPEDAAAEIISDAQGNLRKALLVLEALKMQSFVSIPFNIRLQANGLGHSDLTSQRMYPLQSRIGKLTAQKLLT